MNIVHGDIFAQDAAAIVNPVNCVGVMGGGLALEFKKRYPAMFLDYVRCCRIGLQPGQLHAWMNGRWIINFPTKDHWRDPSRLEYICSGLHALVDFAHLNDVESIALPALGCGLGGLSIGDVGPLIAIAAERMPKTVVTLVLGVA